MPGPGRIVVPPLTRDALLNPRGFVVDNLKLEELLVVEIRDDDSEGGLDGMDASIFPYSFDSRRQVGRVKKRFSRLY